MLTRRDLAKNFGWIAAGLAMGGEAAYAQNRNGKGELILLDANENPEGPPASSIEAMSRVLGKTGRYHDRENEEFAQYMARFEGLKPEQLLLGSGSSEILHCAIDAFTSPTIPLITSSPSYEQPVDMAHAYGRPVIKLPMTKDYSADVRRMAAEAGKARGGLIYVVNPNNPTSSITPKADISWLIENLPPNTIALIDEAYIHFSTSPQLASAIPYIEKGKNIVVARTFSKIYGMAGLRVGYGCARADLISKMGQFRSNVIPLTGLYAAKAALAEAGQLIPRRRQKYDQIRTDLCGWLDARKIGFIPPHANFVMIDVKRDVRPVISAMLERGIAVGRPFPPMNQFLRVTLGTESEMARFKQEFARVMQA